MNLDIPTPYVATIIGKAGSGKSTLIKYLTYSQQCKRFYERFEIIMVFCKTKFNHAYDWVPSAWVHGGYSEKAIKSLMRVQKKIRAQGLKPLPVCLIFDDCLSTKDYQKEFFTDLIANRRHYNISIMFCTQYLARQVPTIMRENSDLVFIFKQFTQNSLQGVYNGWGTLYFNDQYEFQRYMKNLEKYSFLKIDTRTEDPANYKVIARCPAEIPNPRVEYLPEIPLEVLQQI